MHRCGVVALLAVLLNACACEQPGAPGGSGEVVDPERGVVVVLVRTTGSAVAESFAAEWQSRLEEVARAEGAAFHVWVLDPERPAPPGVNLTPLLVFQNHRGRSVYQGRYALPDRFRNFLRTVRWAPLGDEKIRRDDVLLHKDGRLQLALRIKITPVTGRVPAGFDAAAFSRAARTAIDKACARFEPAAQVLLDPSDRTFYGDFYPYVDAGGTLFVSTALFSQFHCDIPVFTGADKPASANLATASDAFAAAARQIEDAVFQSIASPRDGDGFDAMPVTAPLSSYWDDLDLALRAAPPGQRGEAGDAAPALPRRWRLGTPRPEEPPRLLFRFLPPLDSYSGEVRDVTCELTIDEAQALASLRGRVEAEARSVTMGEEALDASLQGTDTLDTARFPRAAFELTAVESETKTLQWGTTPAIALHGTFTMKGISIPLTARAMLEPILDERARPHLIAEGSFELPLKDRFGIAGPDGPSPARDTLRFQFRFDLEPAE